VSFTISKAPRVIYKNQIFLFYFSQFLQESSKLKIVSILICTGVSDYFKVSEHCSGDWTLPESSSIKRYANSTDTLKSYTWRLPGCQNWRRFIWLCYIV